MQRSPTTFWDWTNFRWSRGGSHFLLGPCTTSAHFRQTVFYQSTLMTHNHFQGSEPIKASSFWGSCVTSQGFQNWESQRTTHQKRCNRRSSVITDLPLEFSRTFNIWHPPTLQLPPHPCHLFGRYIIIYRYSHDFHLIWPFFIHQSNQAKGCPPAKSLEKVSPPA